MKDIKIQAKLWELIVQGKKTEEYRKLIKGLTIGTYRFVTVEKYKPWEPGFHTVDCRIILGFAKLTPYHFYPMKANWSLIAPKTTDDITYNFVKDNYEHKHDFVAYKITEVKDISTK